jgi:hypothetical protein
MDADLAGSCDHGVIGEAFRELNGHKPRGRKGVETCPMHDSAGKREDFRELFGRESAS